MADIDKSPETLGLGVLRADIPTPLVDSVLDEQRKTDLFLRFSIQDWEALKAKPNLKHYIAVTAFEASPDDPVMREKVISAQLGLLALIDEAVTNEKLEDVFVDAGSLLDRLTA